jgi:hypothetical protein
VHLIDAKWQEALDACMFANFPGGLTAVNLELVRSAKTLLSAAVTAAALIFAGLILILLNGVSPLG